MSEKAGTAATTQTRNRDREEKRKKALTHLEREGKKKTERSGGVQKKKNHIWSHWIRRLYLFALHTCSPRCARVCVCASVDHRCCSALHFGTPIKTHLH